MFAVNFYASCFVSRGNSVGKKVVRFDWEKAVYRPLFTLANTLKHCQISDDRKNKILISIIVPKGDEYKEKGEMVSKMINEAYHEENIPVINHNNINSKRHLNRSKLDFNNYGNSVFVKNIRNSLSNLI